MKVKELIAALQAEDPEAHVTFWFDVHEGSAPEIAGGVFREFIKLDSHGSCVDYSDAPKDGYEPAVRVS